MNCSRHREINGKTKEKRKFFRVASCDNGTTDEGLKAMLAHELAEAAK